MLRKSIVLAVLAVSSVAHSETIPPLPDRFVVSPNLTGVAVSSDHVCITDITGTRTVCRGNNDHGQLGIPADNVFHNEWVEVGK